MGRNIHQSLKAAVRSIAAITPGWERSRCVLSVCQVHMRLGKLCAGLGRSGLAYSACECWLMQPKSPRNPVLSAEYAERNPPS